MKSPDTLLIDATNLCHIHFHGNKGADDDSYISMTFHTLLCSIKFLYNKFKPKKIIMVFDDKHPSWRKLYTKDIDQCVTHVRYKSKRNKNETPKEKERRATLDKESVFLKEMFQQHTSIPTLSKKYLEGDDIIAGYVQTYEAEDIIIVSSDKDFTQLIGDNVRLYNPVANEFRSLSDWNNDAKLFMFEKCIRGDAGDSVISSYPRLRATKIVEAYTDDFKKNNLLNHIFEVEDIHPETGKLIVYQYETKKLFEENELLMDLSKQPDYIKDMIKDAVANITPSKFNMFQFLKFCGKYELRRIVKDAEQFIKPFSLSGHLDPW